MGEIRVSADLHYQPAERRWRVTMLLSAPDDLGDDPDAVQGEEMNARLFDERGIEMEQLSRPAGPLPALAEELRILVDAPFVFADTGYAPAQLQFTNQQHVLKFEVVLHKTQDAPHG